MNRIDRVSAILVQLQSRKVVKAQQIADRFKVSLRTIYRDIKTLEEAGVPVIGEAGTGYSLMEGYRLPPVMFTKEEALAFLTAEKLVEKLTDTANSKNFQSAMYKVRAVLRVTEKDLLEQVDRQVEVLRVAGKNPVEGNFTELILSAIASNKVLGIDYFTLSRNENNKRNVEPVGIFYLEHNWYLIAYCLMRKDYRQFRFDRIKNMMMSDQLQKRTHPPLKHHIENRFTDKQFVPVKIRVDKYAWPYMTAQKYYMGFIEEKIEGDVMEMSFMSHSLKGFARWFIMVGDHASIVEPEALRDEVSRLIEAVKARL